MELVAGTRVELLCRGERFYAVSARTFADAPRGSLILYEDSYGSLALAVSQGSAAAASARRGGQRDRPRLRGAVIDSQRLARFVTDAVVRRPWLWRIFRGPLRAMFDRLAPTWETRIGPHHLWALDLALEDVPPPRHVLDLGTGTGVVALALAGRYPEAEIVGIDLSPAMIEEARRKLAPELARPGPLRGRRRLGARLSQTATFDLVVLSNMIPFDDELARVAAPGGTLVLSFSRGAETPIYVRAGACRAEELGRRGFAEFAEFSADPATALRAPEGVGSEQRPFATRLHRSGRPEAPENAQASTGAFFVAALVRRWRDGLPFGAS